MTGTIALFFEQLKDSRAQSVAQVVTHTRFENDVTFLVELTLLAIDH
jgi:hypothetical protein